MMNAVNKLSCVAIAAVGAVLMLGLTPSTANAKSCIYNKAGFVLEVHWFKEGQIGFGTDESFYIKQDGDRTRANGSPIPVEPTQVDVFPVLEGRCYEGDEQMIAVLAINKGDWVQPIMTTMTGLFVGINASIASAGACAATLGTGCVGAIAATATGTAAVTAAMGAATQVPTLEGSIPNAFAVELMSKTNYLDVWGTVFAPQTGKGGGV